MARARNRTTWFLLLLFGAGSAFVVKLFLALWTSGTNDVTYWVAYSAYLQRFGEMRLYRDVPTFNHPPFMAHVLHSLQFLTTSTGLPFAFWLRLPGILADVGSIVLMYRILDAPAATTSVRTALVLFSFAPASVMVSGFHGNTDAVMEFFLLLSVMSADKWRNSWLSGAALGMSMNIKVWPVVFTPAIYAYLPDRRHRVQYFTAAAAVFIFGSLPYLLRDPRLILRRVFGYGSIYGDWGLSRLVTSLEAAMPGLGALNTAYFRFGTALMFCAIVLVSFRMDRVPQKPSLYGQCGVIAFTFMLLTPGFGVQYLAWLVPWVVGAGIGPTLIYSVTSGLFLFLVYDSCALREASQRTDCSIPLLGSTGFTVYSGLLCWVSVGVVLALLLRNVGVTGFRSPPARRDACPPVPRSLTKS